MKLLINDNEEMIAEFKSLSCVKDVTRLLCDDIQNGIRVYLKRNWLSCAEFVIFSEIISKYENLNEQAISILYNSSNMFYEIV